MVKRTLRLPARPLSWLAAAIAALVTFGVAPLPGDGSAVAAVTPPATIAVHAEFDPATPALGDRIDARIVIELNRRTVRPQTLHYSYGLAPLQQLGSARVSRFTSGALELVTVVAPVTCVSAPCVADKGVTTLGFGPVRATVSSADGSGERASAQWPKLAIRGRVLPSELASASPSFESDLTPAAPSYSASPSMLSALFDVVAGLCALGAVGLIAWQVLVFVRRRPTRQPDALERALQLARESKSQPVSHRRRALGLLARLLDRDQLSHAARDLAWSQHQPRPDEVEALVSEIDQGRSR